MKSGKRKKLPDSYKVRGYRQLTQAEGLVSSYVKIKETDLHIQADREIQRRAEEIVLYCRLQLEDYILRNPSFYTSLAPLPKDFTAPPLIQAMFDAGRKAGVGPMAAVAGGIAEFVGLKLMAEGVGEIIIENGGDIFLSRCQPVQLAIFAGISPLSNNVGLELVPPMPWAVCTSSGTVGHSLSLGQADSVTVVARSAYLADAAATRLGNEVCPGSDMKKSVKKTLAVAETIEGVVGAVVICGEVLGAVGEVKLIRIEQGSRS
ncbi:MAG: UPF0280 family protein [Desulfopila sp.]|jgi:ApbE superfamily uncharacterized protein (UPF0280 family)|nr:UPF0280 family protein [Desulfopila sp.]